MGLVSRARIQLKGDVDLGRHITRAKLQILTSRAGYTSEHAALGGTHNLLINLSKDIGNI